VSLYYKETIKIKILNTPVISELVKQNREDLPITMCQEEKPLCFNVKNKWMLGLGMPH